MADYNGWTNWATWNANLWVDNEEAIHKDRVRRRLDWTEQSAKEFYIVESWNEEE